MLSWQCMGASRMPICGHDAVSSAEHGCEKSVKLRACPCNTSPCQPAGIALISLQPSIAGETLQSSVREHAGVALHASAAKLRMSPVIGGNASVSSRSNCTCAVVNSKILPYPARCILIHCIGTYLHPCLIQLDLRMGDGNAQKQATLDPKQLHAS